jgi:hypothetical protein
VCVCVCYIGTKYQLVPCCHSARSSQSPNFQVGKNTRASREYLPSGLPGGPLALQCSASRAGAPSFAVHPLCFWQLQLHARSAANYLQLPKNSLPPPPNFWSLFLMQLSISNKLGKAAQLKSLVAQPLCLSCGLVGIHLFLGVQTRNLSIYFCEKEKLGSVFEYKRRYGYIIIPVFCKGT